VDVEQFEFGSPAWCEVLFDEMRRRLDAVDLAGVTWSQCEEFTGPPPSLAPADGGSIGWHIRVSEAGVACVPEPTADVDLRVVVDYATVLPIARMRYEGNPDAEERLAAMRASGEERYRVFGDRAAMPAPVAQAFDGLHDVMVAATR
jgi:hypothetical protein